MAYDVGAHELSALIWRERELLEALVFKLDVEQLLLTAGNSRWISRATREIEQVLDQLRTAGLARSVEVAAVAGQWGTADDATLRELIAQAPDPWREILSDHLDAMTVLTADIVRLRDANEQLLRGGARSAQETLVRFDADAGTYDSHGVSHPPADNAHFFDKDL